MMTWSLTPATPADWALVRCVRLAALADAPDAFCSTLASAQALTEADWRAGLEGEDRLVLLGRAALDRDPVGMVRGAMEGGEAWLYSLWVAPAARGRGLAQTLIQGIATWAQAQGAATLHLKVLAGNEAALALYRRLSFQPMGQAAPGTGQEWALPLTARRSPQATGVTGSPRRL